MAISDDKFTEICEGVARLETKSDEIIKKLDGNGQEGLIKKYERLEAELIKIKNFQYKVLVWAGVGSGIATIIINIVKTILTKKAGG